MSLGWAEQNDITWKEVDFALSKRETPTVAWITCDAFTHLQQLVVDFKLRFEEHQHFDLHVEGFEENSFPVYFHEHLPEAAFEEKEVIPFVHLFGLEGHVGKGLEKPESKLFEVLNFQRELLFQSFPFIVVIWSDVSSQIKAQTLAPDFWDWVSSRFHFESSAEDLISETDFLTQIGEGLGEKNLEKVLFQISGYLGLLEKVPTERERDRASLLLVIARGYWSIKDFDKSAYYSNQMLESSEAISEEMLSLVLQIKGGSLYRLGKFEQAREALDLSLPILQKLNNKNRLAKSLAFLGVISIEEGKRDLSKTYFQKYISLKEELGDSEGVVAGKKWLEGVESKA